MTALRERSAASASLVVPLGDLGRDDLLLAGGKASNLGVLLGAGLPVPGGFCLTTEAYSQASAGAELGPILAELAGVAAEAADRLESLAARARSALLATRVPEDAEQALSEAYRALGEGADVPVAVRSSATAEDLPSASFAGQQETFLNVVGQAALLEAVRRCWASLWTDRAVAYRAVQGIDPRQVRLAVVVQEMVPAAAAGVFFTADPLTGRRRRAVIDASPGLGEAVVSGAVNPDHFVVETATGTVLERRRGHSDRSTPDAGLETTADGPGSLCLTDKQLRTLAALGARVEALFGSPQDVEFAFDQGGRCWLLQARPITTLFPLPPGAPLHDDELRVYFSVNVAQGVLRPFTPMGEQGLRLVGSALVGLAGTPPRDPVAGPGGLVTAASRLFLDLTPALRSRVGRRGFLRLSGKMEARTQALLLPLLADPRLRTDHSANRRFLRAYLSLMGRMRFLPRALGALRNPKTARQAASHAAAEAAALGDLAPGATLADHLNAVERMFLAGVPVLFTRIMPVAAGGLGGLFSAGALLGRRASPEELDAVRRALPHNPTTEMDLELWALADRLRTDPAAAKALRSTPPEALALEFREGALPPALQAGLAAFLADYGHRAVAEIDLGLPRWAEDPTHLLGVLANYLLLEDPALAPDVQFAKAARTAEALVEELAGRAGTGRRRLVRFLLARGRQLAGLREAPKFHFVRLAARARALLRPVGEELARAGRLAEPADIFFLTLPEARAALAGEDQRERVRERRASYDSELRRRHVPRLLLSDGTEPAPPAGPVTAAGALRGSPASAGRVSAEARVILDPTGARLEPGEILVAPSTDPGWTPLFLTAAGLVMEMGGAMSHGAVVAREYGIPAVVGVPGATDRIRTGERITVDGTAGTVTPAYPDDG